MNTLQIIGLTLVFAPVAFMILWKVCKDLPKAIIETFRNGSKEDKFLAVSCVIVIIGMITAAIGSVGSV